MRSTFPVKGQGVDILSIEDCAVYDVTKVVHCTSKADKDDICK